MTMIMTMTILYSTIYIQIEIIMYNSFVHRIIQCKKWLHDQKVINSPSCEMCKEEKVDDMTHHFIEYSGLNNFWNVFENW